MATGLGTELFTLATSFDPYGAYKEGQRAPAEQEIQDIATQQQLQEARAEQAQSLGQMAGGMGQPQVGGMGKPPLAQMAGSMLPPNVRLTNEDGTFTVGGKINDSLTAAQRDMQRAQTFDAQSAQLARQANALRLKDPVKAGQLMKQSGDLGEAARRAETAAKSFKTEAQKTEEAAYTSGVSSLYNGNSQAEWDAARSSFEKETGFPIPDWIPKTFSPEAKKELLNNPKIPKKIRDSIIDEAQKQEKVRLEIDNLRFNLTKKEAKARENEGDGGITGKLPPTKDEREGYTARYQTIRNIDDIQELLTDPKYAKLINPTTKFTPQLIANLQTNFPELSQKLARIQAIEFQLGGKALTATEQKILEPLYGWRGLTADALKKRIAGVQADFQKRNKMEETMYPGLKGVGKKFDEIYGYDPTATKKTETPKSSSGDAKSQAEAAIAAGAPREAVAKKYKELTGKDL
jgi:hypothetical protein